MNKLYNTDYPDCVDSSLVYEQLNEFKITYVLAHQFFSAPDYFAAGDRLQYDLYSQSFYLSKNYAQSRDYDVS